MKISSYIYLSIGLLLVFLVFPYETLFHNSYALFLGNLFLSIWFIKSQKFNIKLFSLFSPCFASYIYISLILIIGSYVDSNTDLNNIMTRMHERVDSFSANHFRIITGLLYINNLILFSIFARMLKKYYETNIIAKCDVILSKTKQIHLAKATSVCSILLLFLLFLFPLDLSLISGEGNFSLYVIIGISIYLSFIFKDLSWFFRIALYSTIVIAVLCIDYNSKRNIIFIFLIFIFFEALKLNLYFRIKIKTLTISLVSIAAFLYLIIVASIMRGYGGYNPDNIFKATMVIPDYIQSTYVLNNLLENFEISWAYVLSYVSFEYVLSGIMPLLLGKTIFRFFLAPIPRVLLPEKPIAFVLQFTAIHTPDWEGTSPVLSYCELFANFFYLHALFVLLVYILLEYLFYSAINSIENNKITLKSYYGLYLTFTVINYTRGQGLSDYFLLPVISMPFVFVIQYIYNNETGNK